MAVGVVGTLAQGGLTPEAIAWWWRRERQELEWRSPREHLLLGRPAQQLLDLADADVAALPTRATA